MSNNSSQKNEIYSQQQLNSLPYGDLAAVKYGNDTTLAAARLNNTFAQLVDNDKVIEYQLAHMSSYNVGPKTYDEDAIYAGDDGYKTWKNDDDDQLSILRKIDLPLQDSIVKVDGISCEARCICRAAEKTFVGTTCGLYVSDDGQDFQLSSPDGFYAAYSDSIQTFFVGEAGVYQLNSENYNVETASGTVVRTRYFLSKRNKNDMGTCTAVYVRDDSQTIYVGTEDGVYSCVITKDTQAQDMVFERLDILMDGVEVTPRVGGIQQLAHNAEIADETLDVVIATSNGLYQSHEMDGVTGRSTALGGTDVKLVTQFMGRTYAVTSYGMYDVTNSKYVFTLAGAKCCAKSDSAIFIGGIGKVVRYSPYAAEGSVTEISVPDGSAVEQVFLIRPVEPSTGTTLDVLVGRLSTGEMFTMDTGTLEIKTGYEIPVGPLSVMYASSRNKLYASGSPNPNALSVFDVSNYHVETSQAFGPLSAYALTDSHIVAYVSPTGQTRPLNKMVCATPTGISDRLYGYTAGGSDVTLFKAMVSPDGTSEYGMIDGGKFKALTGTLAKVGTERTATDFSDTNNLIVTRSGSALKYVQKGDLYGDVTDFPTEFPSEPQSMQSDGINVYFLIGSTLSAVGENPVLSKSEELSDRAVYDVKTLSDFNMVVAATSEGLEFHALSDVGEEKPVDVISSFPGNVHRCEAFNGMAYAYTDHGISAFQISALDDGSVSVQILTGDYPAYSDQDIYDRKKIDIGTGYELMATSSGLSVGHYEFARAVYGLTIDSGYFLEPKLYALRTSAGFSFYDEDDQAFSFTQNVSALVRETDQETGTVSAYFGGPFGISCVQAVSSDGEYEYSGDPEKVSDFSTSFISQQTEFLSDESKPRGILVADTQNVYSFGDYSTPVAQFGEIRSLDNYYTTEPVAQQRIFVSDNGTLRECDIASGTPVYKTYSNITEVEKVVVDEYGVREDESYEKHATVLVLKNNNLYSFDIDDLAEDMVFGSPILTGVTDLRESTREPYKAQIYASSGKCIYTIDEDGQLQKIYESSTELTMYEQAEAYATGDSVYLYEKQYSLVDSRKCVQLSCGENSVSGFYMSLFDDGSMYAGTMNASMTVDEFTVGNLLASNIASFAGSDDKVMTVGKDKTYCPDISYPETKYDFSSYSISLNGFIESTSQTRMLFEFPTNSIMFATSAGIYGTDIGKAEISLKTSFEFGTVQNRFSLLKASGGGIYIVQDADLFQVLNMKISRVASFTSNIEDVIRSEDVFYVKMNGGWYSTRTSGEIAETQLAGYDVLDILCGSDSSGKAFGGSSDSMLAVTESGLYCSDKIQIAKLTVKGISGSAPHVFSGQIRSVTGSESGGTDAVNVTYADGSYVKYCQYSYPSGTVTDVVKALVSNSYVNEFCGIYPVNGDIDNGKTFATVSSATDLYEADGEILTPYPDIRITMRSDLTVNSAAQIGEEFYICTTAGTFVSKKRGKQRYFDYVADVGYNFTGSVEASNTRYLFASQSGLFTMVNKGQPLSRSVYKNEAKSEETLFVKKYNTGTLYDTYAYASGCSVLTSDNAKKFTTFLVLPEPECKEGETCYPLSVWDIYAQSRNEYYFATSEGLYRTQYSYVLSNDIQKFTALDAKNAYDGMQDELSAEYDKHLQNHIASEHACSTDIIPYVNDNMLSVSFDGIVTAGWNTKSQNETSTEMYISNDMVYEVLYGNQDTGDVYVNTSNFLTSETNASCSYIFKRYMSGMSELYIYVPTTHTYYISHMKGTPGCSLYGQEIKRQNLKGFSQDTFQTDVTQQYTEFEIGIDSTFLSIDTLLGVQVNGNSLPLKVYRDTSCATAENDACLMYHSFIESSEMMTPIACVSADEDGEYKLKFACFGSDAQAVKITVYDALNGIGLSTYKVIYHANGAQGSMTVQRFVVGVQKKLRKCSFYWPSTNMKVFNGWTTEVDPPDDSEAMYSDQQYFGKDEGEIEDGAQIHLYAVWLTYQFGENDTVLAIGNTSEEFYIDGATVIPDIKLGNKVIVDYGD